MFRITTPLCRLFLPVIGCTFLVDTLYGCKYSPHIGVCNLPYMYIKTLLFCSSGRGLQESERSYVRGLIHYLIQDNDLQGRGQTKLELIQFLDAMPSRININSGNILEGQKVNEPPPPPPPPSSSSQSTGTWGTTNSSSNPSVSSSSPSVSPPSVSDNTATFLSGALIPSALARVLLYDAVCACVEDGDYNDIERGRISQVAAKLGIPQHVRGSIEKVVVQERQLAKRKQKLLLLK